MIQRLKGLARREYRDGMMFLQKISGRREVCTTLQTGDRFIIRIHDRIGREILMDESYEKTTREMLLSKIRKGMTVLDIGANIGYYTVLMARAVGDAGRVIAVEPHPAMVEELRRNIRINQIRNVAVEQVALSSDNGEAEFYCPESGAESHGSLKPNRTFDARGTIRVATERVDDMLARIGCRKVDLVKMDVEGAEYSIFLGSGDMLTRMRPEIVFECAENLCEAFGHTVFDVLAYLNAKGYRPVQFDYGMWDGKPSSVGSAAHD